MVRNNERPARQPGNVKVLHVIPSVSASQGGPSFAMPLIERALASAGVEVTVATTDDDGPGKHLNVDLEKPIPSGGATRFYFRKQTEFYKYSLPLKRWLNQNARQFDMVHVHALFSHASVSAARAARKQNVPYIIRPLGVLNRYGLTQRRAMLKRISLAWIERPLLRDAAAMHYTSKAEQLEAEAAGACAPAFVIPLGIDLARFGKLAGADLFLSRFPQAKGKPIVLFLSRLDPKKGLDILLPAFAEVKELNPQAMLVVAGSGDETFTRNMKVLAAELELGDSVLWPGFLEGEMKLSALAAATVFVLPSYSENFGIALVEAMAAGVPCLTTEGVAVAGDVAENKAGLVAKPIVSDLACSLNRVLSDSALRERLSASARSLARKRFSLDAMGRALKELYSRVIMSKTT